MIDAAALPDWPALMSEDLACAYLSVSSNSLRIIAMRNNVDPVDTGLEMKRWRRRDLDRLVDSLPSKRPDGSREQDPPADLAQEALARVQAAAGGRRRRP